MAEGAAHRPRARRSPEEARTQILDAAESVLARLGPDRAGLKEVAAEARVSHALVTHYFGRFEALVESVLERALARARARVTVAVAEGVERSAAGRVIEAVFEGFRERGTARLVTWALLRGGAEAEGGLPHRVQGLKAVANVVERMVGAPRELVEFAVLTAATATLGYVVGDTAYEAALGRVPSQEREERYARFLGNLLSERLLAAGGASASPTASAPVVPRVHGKRSAALPLAPGRGTDGGTGGRAPAAVGESTLPEVTQALLRAGLGGEELEASVRLVAGWCESEGLEPGRVNLAVITHHPALAGIGYAWTRQARQVTRHERPWGFLDSAEHLASPLHVVMTTRERMRLRVARREGLDRFAILREFAEAGATDYLALPLVTSRGDVHVLTTWTDRPGGWTDGEVVRLGDLTLPMATVVELSEHRRLARTLVETYLGPRTGPRVLDGKIHRGDHERIRAAVWFSDVRSFTDATERHGDEAMVRALDGWFELAISAVHAEGGEVLKLMGDGVLAIFPVEKQGWNAATDAALSAAFALHEAERARVGRAELPLRSAVALHAGEVLYGNIGSARRLDFTVIGTTVNAAARLTGLCRTLEEPVLVSEAFARRSGRGFTNRGEHVLRGLRSAMKVFAPRALEPEDPPESADAPEPRRGRRRTP